MKPFLLHYNFRQVEVEEKEFDSIEEAVEACVDPNGDFGYNDAYDSAKVYEIVDGKRVLVREITEDDVMEWWDKHGGDQ